MTEFWTAVLGRWAHGTAVGGVLLLLGWIALQAVRCPAWRQRLGAWAVRGAVLAVGVGLLPAWLTVTLPAPVFRGAARQTEADNSSIVLPAPIEAQGVEMASKTPPGPPSTEGGRKKGGPSLAASPDEPSSSPPRLRGGRGGSDFSEPGALVATVEEDPIQPPPVDVPEEAPVASVPSAPEADAPQQSPAPAQSLPLVELILPLLVAAYFATVAVLLGQLVVGHLRLMRAVRGSHPAPARVLAVSDDLAAKAGVRPAVRVCDSLASPVCFGLLRPMILLPRAFAANAPAERLRWVLAHELDHVARGDHRTAYWVAAARAAFFPLPWAWAFRRELLLAQEHLADAAAAAVGGRPADYAAFLVDLSGDPADRRAARSPLAATGVRAGRSDLYRRVTMILQSGPSTRRVSKRWAVAVGGGVLSAAVLAAGVGFAAPPKSADAPPPPTPAVEPVPAPPPVRAVPRVAEVQIDVNDLKLDVNDPELDKLLERLKKAVGEGKDAADLKKQIDEVQKRLKDLPRIAPPPVVLQPLPPLQPVAPLPVPPPPVRVVPRGVVVVDDGDGPAPKSDLRAQFDKQLKDFDAAIEKAADDDARAALKTARDAYKKAMADDLAKADAARGEAEKAQGVARDEAARARARLMQMQKEMMDRLQKEGGLKLDAFPVLDQPLQFQRFGDGNGVAWGVGPRRNAAQPRLGVATEKPTDVLAEQLDLAKGVGLVVTQVTKGSAAEKAGLKANDVLVKLAGKDVPDDAAAFAELVGKLKAGEKLDAEVVRKGKKEAVKGIELAEAAKPKAKAGGFSQMSMQVSDGEASVSATTAEGVKYEVKGPIADGKLTPSKITISDGGSVQFDSLEKVPEKHRAIVDSLIQRAQGVRVVR